MSTFLWILYFVLFCYVLLLLGRFVVELVQSFARRWRPSGPGVVVIEFVFTLTDPPVKLLRRLIPPLSLGPVRLDLSLMIVLIVLSILMRVVLGFAIHTT
ncbi:MULTISPECIES: YggT family protein [Gordonia]|uniref:YggT family protein n=2 Tax=Gordonia TaxID=2053 RepID=L7LGM1_9ACTN|nr:MULTISPECIES: YggT family protein [Gordonia]AUH68774.1 YggT family protein [Gordonia sp. YC-JH1]KJR09250.1 membrane protein [Gordonia sihwensis]KXT58069.1 membrane protein [Gordonia sp. QH-12]MBY4571375.1 YggT family protein [Gordonia sihwensis]WFN91361.1 YggT family protein [Gordonia sihwensis]